MTETKATCHPASQAIEALPMRIGLGNWAAMGEGILAVIDHFAAQDKI